MLELAVVQVQAVVAYRESSPLTEQIDRPVRKKSEQAPEILTSVVTYYSAGVSFLVNSKRNILILVVANDTALG